MDSESKHKLNMIYQNSSYMSGSGMSSSAASGSYVSEFSSSEASAHVSFYSDSNSQSTSQNSSSLSNGGQVNYLRVVSDFNTFDSEQSRAFEKMGKKSEEESRASDDSEKKEFDLIPPLASDLKKWNLTNFWNHKSKM